MIFYFSGEFKSKLSEKIVDAIDLFDILEKRGFLDSNNLLYLQSLLDHVNRHDLFELVANFASETLQNAVYFQKQPDEPGMYHFEKFKCIVLVTIILYQHERNQMNKIKSSLSINRERLSCLVAMKHTKN